MFGFSFKAGVSSSSRVGEMFSIPHLADPCRVSVLGVRSSLLTFICAGDCSRLVAVKILFFFKTSDTEHSRIRVTLNGERYLLHKDVTDPSAAM